MFYDVETSHLQLKMDAEEMEKMVNQAARQHVKGILTIELHKMRTHISKLMDEAKSKESEDSKDVKPKTTEVSSRRYTKSITNYGMIFKGPAKISR